MANKGNVTILGQETDFEGVMEYTDNLVVTGKFRGTIKSLGALEIDKAAVCEVKKITAKSVVIAGHVTGDVEGLEHVELCNGSKLKGNIRTSTLRIGDNVEFEGQIQMMDEIPDIDIFSVASDEYKNALILKSNELKN